MTGLTYVPCKGKLVSELLVYISHYISQLLVFHKFCSQLYMLVVWGLMFTIMNHMNPVTLAHQYSFVCLAINHFTTYEACLETTFYSVPCTYDLPWSSPGGILNWLIAQRWNILTQFCWLQFRHELVFLHPHATLNNREKPLIEDFVICLVEETQGYLPDRMLN